MKIGILWDLDGTLLDTLQDLTAAVNFARRNAARQHNAAFTAAR